MKKPTPTQFLALQVAAYYCLVNQDAAGDDDAGKAATHLWAIIDELRKTYKL